MYQGIHQSIHQERQSAVTLDPIYDLETLLIRLIKGITDGETKSDQIKKQLFSQSVTAVISDNLNVA